MFMDPVQMLNACHLRTTDSVADFGAGSGLMAKTIASIVTSGDVFAVEINRDLVARIIHEVEDSHIKNIHPLWGDVEIIGGSKLGDKSVDVAVFSNILFQLDDKKNALKEAFRILKEGGHLIVVDWQESFGGLGPRPERVLNQKMAEELITSIGFTKLSDIKPAGEHHYAILFKK